MKCQWYNKGKGCNRDATHEVNSYYECQQHVLQFLKATPEAQVTPLSSGYPKVRVLHISGPPGEFALCGGLKNGTPAMRLNIGHNGYREDLFVSGAKAIIGVTDDDVYDPCEACIEMYHKDKVPAMHEEQKKYPGRLSERKYDAKTDMVERVYPKDKNGKPPAGCVSINPESAVAQAVSKLESDRKKTYYWDPYFCDGDWW